ncbi:unnamed protein product (macronuclear) [Paramecium tetraurelia]|uniref:Uncharacterized protein n=1 Tax=Paramecium tetraurelia TaxID=5888 RepID=A0C2V5_PARTE|nr:uncharacterized protein GSPATT00034600001 [Paramecium tetraurelia]CAK65122.1 unnamed protein product [Paramecium tetraurelia]|eukprot:XP_001432519.1 hypothetical protein (macronuclear) [Paramecium tetraurelia strain d4-2]
MNSFSLEKNRFHQKACQKKKKGQSENLTTLSKKQQIDTFIEQKTQTLYLDVNQSYTKASDQESFNLNKIPKSLRANLIGQLNNKYKRRSPL